MSQVFGNSNSLPISLVLSLSQTLTGLHWDRIPNDNDDEVAARGILYLLIFQQLGQFLRWTWGYHVLLAPKRRYLQHDDDGANRIEQGQAEYSDNPEQIDPDEPLIRTGSSDDLQGRPLPPQGSSSFPSGEQTPVTSRTYSVTAVSDEEDDSTSKTIDPLASGQLLPEQNADWVAYGNMDVFRRAQTEERWGHRWKHSLHRSHQRVMQYWEKKTEEVFSRLPSPLRNVLSRISIWTGRFLHGVWDFMNPPLWAMLISIVVASVPALQHLFFDEGTFIRNSVTMAINQTGQVAVPLILVVLGANLARNTLPKEALDDMTDPKEERNLIIASLVSRMLLSTLIMAPILALVVKYVPVSILDDPIFVIVCFLVTGAPTALQLAQICQINNVFIGAMSRLLFHSYVVWYVNPPCMQFACLTSIGSFRLLLFLFCAPWRSSNGLLQRRSITVMSLVLTVLLPCMVAEIDPKVRCLAVVQYSIHMLPIKAGT